jgi:hypothetical protein
MSAAMTRPPPAAAACRRDGRLRVRTGGARGSRRSSERDAGRNGAWGLLLGRTPRRRHATPHRRRREAGHRRRRRSLRRSRQAPPAGDRDAAQQERAGDTDENNAAPKLGRNEEIGEQQREQEDVVERGRALDQIDGRPLAGRATRQRDGRSGSKRELQHGPVNPPPPSPVSPVHRPHGRPPTRWRCRRRRSGVGR